MADERKGYFSTGKVAVPGPDDSAEMVEAARHPAEGEAKVAAVHLVEAGIGAEVHPLTVDPVGDAADPGGDAADPVGDADDPGGDAADPGDGEATPSAGSTVWRVMVLRSDLERAAAVLLDGTNGKDGAGGAEDTNSNGGAVGDARPEVDDDDSTSGLLLEKEKIPWRRVLLIFIVALVVLPGAAFWLTMRALGGDCPSGPDVPVSVILNTTC